MERAKQVTGGIVAGVMAAVVTVAAAWALWVSAPLLNPCGRGFSASDIPIINTDAKINRPIPPAQLSPRAGVVRPAPSTAKPKRTLASRNSSRKPSRTSSPRRRAVARATRAPSSKARASYEVAVRVRQTDARERSDDSGYSDDSRKHSKHSKHSEHSDHSRDSKHSDHADHSES